MRICFNIAAPPFPPAAMLYQQYQHLATLQALGMSMPQQPFVQATPPHHLIRAYWPAQQGTLNFGFFRPALHLSHSAPALTAQVNQSARHHHTHHTGEDPHRDPNLRYLIAAYRVGMLGRNVLF